MISSSSSTFNDTNDDDISFTFSSSFFQVISISPFLICLFWKGLFWYKIVYKYKRVRLFVSMNVYIDIPSSKGLYLI